MSSTQPAADRPEAPVTTVLRADDLQPARGGMRVKTGLRAGKAKSADKAFQAMDAYLKG